MNLTAKQEQFCQNIFLGMNQAEAYRKAYSAQNMLSKTIWEKASRLAHQDKVVARVEALRYPGRLILEKASVKAAERLVQLIDAREEVVNSEGSVIGLRKNTRVNLRAASDVLNFLGYKFDRKKIETKTLRTPPLPPAEVKKLLSEYSE